MELIIVLLYCCFAFILFFFFNLSYKEDNNYPIFKILFPVIYIIILASIFTDIGFKQFNDYIFLIIVFEFIIRIYYMNYILKQDLFLDNKYNFKMYFISICISYIINIYFINKVDNVFLTPSEFRIVLWLFIFSFGYKFLREYFSNSFSKKIDDDNNQKNEYFIISYAKLKNKYRNTVSSKDKKVVDIVYAIMVYENFKRPPFLRKLDLFKSKFTNELSKQGIMQVDSKNYLTDIDSILLATKNIEKIATKLNSNTKTSKSNFVSNVLSSYYKKDSCYKDVLFIYDSIVEFNRYD